MKSKISKIINVILAWGVGVFIACMVIIGALAINEAMDNSDKAYMVRRHSTFEAWQKISGRTNITYDEFWLLKTQNLLPK